MHKERRILVLLIVRTNQGDKFPATLNEVSLDTTRSQVITDNGVGILLGD
jgi:hypothetical protein